MYQPINQVRLRGFLTEPARLFVARSGLPRIPFGWKSGSTTRTCRRRNLPASTISRCGLAQFLICCLSYLTAGRLPAAFRSPRRHGNCGTRDCPLEDAHGRPA